MMDVCENVEPIIITRQGAPSVVIISLEEYSRMVDFINQRL